MQESLVSIITPCFNMEKTISRLMDSIITQTYRPIEFILIDDGSTDNSYSIADSYKLKFEIADISYKLIHQENKGLGGAINTGLNAMTGEYFCWPDADDYLEPTSVEEKIKAFREHPDFAVVTSNAYIRLANNLDSVCLLVNKDLKKHEYPNQFFYHLNSESIFCPGCHMVKASAFFDVNSNGYIFPAKRGQNWQLLLPIFFKYKRYFLNKPLYNYIIYSNSMSHSDVSYKNYLDRLNEHERIIIESLEKIKIEQNADVSEYKKFIINKYSKLKMNLAVKYSRPDCFIREYKYKKSEIGIDMADRINYIMNINKYRILNKPLSIIYKVLIRIQSLRYSRKMLNKNIISN